MQNSPADHQCESTSTQSQHGRPNKVNRGKSNRNPRYNPKTQTTNNEFAISDSSACNQVEGSSDNRVKNSSNGSTGRILGYRSNKGNGPGVGGGKYRQRHQTHQFIEGMSTMNGLDIDLVESIAPTSSNTRQDTPKSRHATNNRKVNLSHLLNYNIDHHPRGRYRTYSSSRGDNISHQRKNTSHYRDPGIQHKFSKQQFLQANCQFVVLNGHDYSIHRVDPDWPVDWDCIEEVRFKQTSCTETTCPICLEPPVAAKITRCGHIYCWTCMLHYLSLSDENCRQCPICFEPVYRSDLRSVVSHSFSNYSVDDEIVMRLMIRNKGCVEVEPYDFYIGQPLNHSQESESDLAHKSQANLIIVEPSNVINNIIQRDKEELLFKLNTDRDEPEVCFVEQALNALERRVEKLNQIRVNSEKPKAKINDSPSSLETSKSYLFYQCLDGQHIYLNPFSTKILCHEYGNLENCPLQIKAKILQMDWVFMNEAWRKRFRYLEHLPLTREFRLVEIDFEKSGLISPETYHKFEDQIKKRKQERDRRLREERKREKIISVEQNRRIYGIQPSLKINLNNIHQFPSVSDERYLGLSQASLPNRPEEESSSADDESAINSEIQLNEGDQASSGEQINQEAESSVAKSDPSMTSVALSFKEIQLQEAAKAAAEGSDQRFKPVNNIWAAKTQQSLSRDSNLPTSSFAGLLTDTKISSRQWTKSNNLGKANNSSGFLPHMSHSSSSQWPSVRKRVDSASDQYDDGEEELRAPPSEFTISDFIDLNVKSNSGKKKIGKQNKTGPK